MKTLAEKIAVMQAAARGEPIESRFLRRAAEVGPWVLIDNPQFDWSHVDYRVAPKKEVVKYRRFLWRTSTGPEVLCAPSSATATCISSQPEFIRWIDDDWQIVEV